MAFGANKVISAASLFVVAMCGAFGALRVSSLSPSWVHVCNAFAGGTMMAVSVVHMLPDSVADTAEAGKAIASALGGDGEFPLGNTIFVVGFLLCAGIQALTGHHSHGRTDCAREMGEELVAAEGAGHGSVFPISGIATFLGLSLHSIIEALAAGTQDQAMLLLITVAICLHKGFAAFALGTAMLELRDKGRICAWWIIVGGWCLTAPIGIAIGALLEAGLDGPGVAALNCLAAGTLLFVGIVEMLVPALADQNNKYWTLVAAIISSVSMSILAVWA